MPTNGNNGVIGTDNVVPIYDPEGRWCVWGLHEIYIGQEGANKYVPKVNDYVIEYENYTTYIVDFVDPVTLISTLRVIRPANMVFSLSETDILFGVGPGTQADTYRVYIDKSVTPHLLAVDIRLKVAGTMANYAKIFRGSDLSSNGNIISKVYDSNGHFVSQNVPLELVAIDNHVNYSIKTVKVCHVTEDLPDGEIVTVVIYNSAGNVVSKRQLLVENTSFIRSVNASVKYITHISMDCAFMSTTFDHVIEYPLNLPLNALNLMGTVHYSDGSVLTLPVNGTKFTLQGMDSYISSIIGQKIDLVLNYALSPNEISYAGVGVENKNITEPYSLVTINPNNSYTVKLFGYPIWINETVGYTMSWWLFNLDRNLFFEVTPFVTYSVNTGPYDPKAYGYRQRKAVSINLNHVSGIFKEFIHTQVVDIVLNAPPNMGEDSWYVSHEASTTRPMYGNGLYAKQIAVNKLLLSSELADVNEWLNRIYHTTFPLINPNTELNPMRPTHFVLTCNGISADYPLSDWDKILTITGSIDLYRTVTIRFIKRSGTNDIQLAIAALLVKP